MPELCKHVSSFDLNASNVSQYSIVICKKKILNTFCTFSYFAHYLNTYQQINKSLMLRTKIPFSVLHTAHIRPPLGTLPMADQARKFSLMGNWQGETVLP